MCADPFMGEGKQNYIDRCVDNTEIPDYSQSEIKEFCECFADKVEKGYEEMLIKIERINSKIDKQKIADKYM